MTAYTAILNHFTIYIGSLFLIAGVPGNLINAVLFYKSNLRNPSTLLLFLASCINFVYILLGLVSRIISAAFNTDVASSSLPWCRMRFYLLQVLALSSMTCICYATIDRFFLSSQYERLRRLSDIARTRRVICLLIIFWLLYSIPLTIFSDLTPLRDGTKVCTFVSHPGFNRFASYFNLPIVWSVLPIIVLVVFGALTYRNVNLLKNVRHRRKAQHYLTSMILLHIIFIVIGTLPYALFYTYKAFTMHLDKSITRKDFEIFLSKIVAVILYLSNSCSFLVYYLASATYRQQVKKLLHLPTEDMHSKPTECSTSELRTLTI